VIGGLNRSTQRYRRRADCNGVPQAAELQELDAWKAEQTVKRYAHFAPEQLRAAADKLATFSYRPPKSETREPAQAIE
jgi:hypothetical protein